MKSMFFSTKPAAVYSFFLKTIMRREAATLKLTCLRVFCVPSFGPMLMNHTGMITNMTMPPSDTTEDNATLLRELREPEFQSSPSHPTGTPARTLQMSGQFNGQSSEYISFLCRILA